MVDKEFASHLKKYREIAEITQNELAEEIGISRQSVISLELGKCVPSVALALKISELFGMPVEFIFRTNYDVALDKDKENEEDNAKIGGSMSRDLMPWSPLREIMSMRETVDRFFDEPDSQSLTLFNPTVGIRETDKELIIELDLPGVKEEDIDVEVEKDKLIIKGERKLKEQIKKEDYFHLESAYGSFSRIITLPSYVDADKSEAEVKDGILEIIIPKVEQKKSKKLQIKKAVKKEA